MTDLEKREKTISVMQNLGIEIRLYEHGAVYTMDEVEELCPKNFENEIIAKNLFLKEHNEEKYYLIVVGGNKHADIKSVRRYLGTKPLSFATEEQLEQRLGVTHGAVTPLGIIFDREGLVSVIVDDDLRGDVLFGVHPCENTSTVYLKYDELEKFAASCGKRLINMQV